MTEPQVDARSQTSRSVFLISVTALICPGQNPADPRGTADCVELETAVCRGMINDDRTDREKVVGDRSTQLGEVCTCRSLTSS